MDEGLFKKSFALPGATHEVELYALAKLAGEVKDPNVIVEVGTMHGRSTLALAAGATVKFYTIEYNPRSPYCPQGAFTQIYNEASDVARTWKDGPVGLLFIDDDHDESVTVGTITAWLPHLAPDSIVVLHDFNLLGVQNVVRKALPLDFGFDCSVVLLGIFRRHWRGSRYSLKGWIQTPDLNTAPVWRR